MAELIFIAATVFVAYTLFTVLGDNTTQTTDNHQDQSDSTIEVVEPVMAVTATEHEAVAEIEAVTPTKPAASRSRSKAAVEKVPVKPKSTRSRVAAKSASVASVAASSAVLSDSLKNPKTGEVVKIPNSYAFAKRWVKEALVEEKLLDKIYKNNELDDAANAKIQAAMQQLRQMSKYQ